MLIKLDTSPFPRDVFRRKLPSAAQTHLLRFCLLPDPAAAEAAWGRWRALGADPAVLLRQNPRSIRGVNNLLVAALARHRQTPGKEVGRALRAQATHERARSELCRDLTRAALAALNAADIQYIVLKGAALTELVYPRPTDRHCHDIDLMIREQDAGRACDALAGPGFHPRPAGGRRRGRSWCLVHSTGLPIVLHAQPFAAPAPPGSWDAFRDQAVPARILDESVHVLPSHLSIVQVAAQAFFGGRHGKLRWVSDIWFDLVNRPPDDWEAFLRCARTHHLSGIVRLMAGYLHDELDAPFPEAVIDALARDSAQDRRGAHLAFSSVWQDSRRDMPALIHLLGGRRLRLAALRWLLAGAGRTTTTH